MSNYNNNNSDNNSDTKYNINNTPMQIQPPDSNDK